MIASFKFARISFPIYLYKREYETSLRFHGSLLKGLQHLELRQLRPGTRDSDQISHISSRDLSAWDITRSFWGNALVGNWNWEMTGDSNQNIKIWAVGILTSNFNYSNIRLSYPILTKVVYIFITVNLKNIYVNFTHRKLESWDKVTCQPLKI